MKQRCWGPVPLSQALCSWSRDFGGDSGRPSGVNEDDFRHGLCRYVYGYGSM